MINGTIAGSFTRGCAERDLQILVLIEERESASDAMVTMMNARMICYDGPSRARRCRAGENEL